MGLLALVLSAPSVSLGQCDRLAAARDFALLLLLCVLCCVVCSVCVILCACVCVLFHSNNVSTIRRWLAHFQTQHWTLLTVLSSSGSLVLPLVSNK